jgi:hypothetical protein
LTAAPLCVLPAKDTVEELFWKKDGMTMKINVLVTLGIVSVCYILAIFITQISYAITIAGCTTNPMVIHYIIYGYRLGLLYLLYFIGRLKKIRNGTQKKNY